MTLALTFFSLLGAGYAWGVDTEGQLGVGAGDAEVVSTPRRIVSKHLENMRIIQVSYRPATTKRCCSCAFLQIAQAEQHTLILAEQTQDEESDA